MDEEISAIFNALVVMIDLVDEQLADAVNALFSNDRALAQRVRERDGRVDALELRIDRACEQVLRHGQPTETALRKVIAAMRINADLERIGDHCKNVAKGVLHLDSASVWRSETPIMEMVDIVRAIIRETRDAFIQQDRLLTRQVLAHDRQVDRVYREVIDALIGLCRRYPEHAETFVHLVTISKALERMADHAKNIARSVVFFIEGVDIRHQKVQSMTGR